MSKNRTRRRKTPAFPSATEARCLQLVHSNQVLCEIGKQIIDECRSEYPNHWIDWYEEDGQWDEEMLKFLRDELMYEVEECGGDEKYWDEWSASSPTNPKYLRIAWR